METAPQLQDNWKQSDPNPVSLLVSPCERLSLHVIVLRRREKRKEKKIKQTSELEVLAVAGWLLIQ